MWRNGCWWTDCTILECQTSLFRRWRDRWKKTPASDLTRQRWERSTLNRLTTERRCSKMQITRSLSMKPTWRIIQEILQRTTWLMTTPSPTYTRITASSLTRNKREERQDLDLAQVLMYLPQTFKFYKVLTHTFKTCLPNLMDNSHLCLIRMFQEENQPFNLATEPLIKHFIKATMHRTLNQQKSIKITQPFNTIPTQLIQSQAWLPWPL